MTYPSVLDEFDTMQLAVTGKSIARFGDGELNICRGGKSVSQSYDPKLREELLAILRGGVPQVVPCIPNVESETPRRAFWAPYASPFFTAYYGRGVRFGSSFVTRPDNAPWIDRRSYWEAVEGIWRGKDVTLVGGDRVMFDVIKPTCRTLTFIAAPRRDAYAKIDDLEGLAYANGRLGPVIICLGAAGTALAARLAKRGCWALDLGHIGMFMNPDNNGAFAIKPEELASPEYRGMLQHEHATSNWGKGGWSWAEKISVYALEVSCKDVLDYGCGQGTLKPALAKLGYKCGEYDPGIPGKDIPPKLADLVVSTDVFEHIEPEKVAAVLKHTFLLAKRAGFFAIAKQPAKKILSDGRNAHLVCQPTEWWTAQLKQAGWKTVQVREDQWKKCVIVCTK